MEKKSDKPDTILVVDDQPKNIQVVGATLRSLGFEVVPATSADEADGRIAARVPDLILLDVRMPGTDGIRYCRRLKSDSDTSDIPVIFLSAADDSSLIVEALEAGGVDYVTKPFNKAELLSRVRTHLALKHAHEETQKLLQQREELIGILAHDIKNPIAGVRLSAQLLVENAADLPDRAAKLAHTIADGAQEVQSFVERFLDYFANQSVITALDIADVEITEIAHEASSRHVPAAKAKSITIEKKIPDEPVVARGCGVALGQVIDNLVSNAIKFSPSDGLVTVSVVTAPGGGAVISVADTGPGLTAEDKQKLFKRFSRLSAKPTGGETSTGLGLSIVKRLTELMGGTIECESEPGQGAKFTVTLKAPENTAA